MRLGPPGVKVGPGLLYNELGRVVARQSVLLPEAVGGFKGTNMPVTRGEVEGLPADTTFGRKLYSNQNFFITTSVVLMGSDRTSIHQPQYCLDAQGWQIDKTEQVWLRMDHPYSYLMPALKLTTSRNEKNKLGQLVPVHGVYVYWFVSADRLTSDQGTRMWSLARTMLQKGELERWAYISYFAACHPGHEETTFKEIVRFIQASAPEFQTVAGQPVAGRSPVAKQ
jgi:hypothetical protein